MSAPCISGSHPASCSTAGWKRRRARVVTFANGLVARELIVDVDDDARRLVWAVVGGRLTHHNASMQVFAAGAQHTCVVWQADLLPDELAATVAGMIEQGLATMKATLEMRAAA